MRLSLFGAALAGLALAAPARAQAPASSAVPVAHPAEAVYVVPHGPGEAVRVTTIARRPSVGSRLDRYRGIRVFRGGSVSPVVVSATPAARVTQSPDGRFVQHGGAHYPVVRR